MPFKPKFKKIFAILKDLHKKLNSQSITNCEEEIYKTQDEENDLLELLMESEKQEISKEEKTNVQNSLIEFNKASRIKKKEDIVHWWSKNRSEDLKMLANVA